MDKKFYRPLCFLITFLMLAGLLTTSVWAENARVSIEKISYPILSLTGQAQQRSVSWWAPPDTQDAELFYGTDANLTSKKSVAAQKSYSAEGVGSFSGFTSYEAVMTSLQKNTTYYYQISIKTDKGTQQSTTYSFYTGDEGAINDAFTFLYLGDAQADESVSEYDQWLELLENAGNQGKDIAFTLMGGDMVNYGQDASEWEEYLKRASTVFQSVPVMSIPGNHECNDTNTYRPTLYKKLFAMPQNGPDGFEEEFYSFNYGNCHILTLNSNIFEPLAKGKITQKDMDGIESWIANDLKNSKADFNIVVTHHPAYAVVSDKIAKQVLENWSPIFEAGNVDLVLCGHQHVYMRTKPMLQGKENKENGITYIMGVSGRKLYSQVDVPYAEVMQGQESNYQLLTVQGDQLTVTAKDADGTTLDQAVIKSKTEKRKQQAIAEKINLARKQLGKQSGVKVSALAYNKARVSWSAKSGAEGYEIYEAKGKHGQYKRIARLKKTSGTRYTRSGIATGTTYYYKVRAYRTVEGTTVYSSFSDAKAVKPSLKKTSVKLSAGKRKMTIRWKKVSGASGYQIYRSKKKTKSYKRIKTIARGSTTKYTNKKLCRGKKYYYKVRSYRKVSGKKVYSSFSTVKYKKVK